MQKHFVTFMSPGTFFDEQSTKEIASWDVMLAVEMSRGIVERYAAKPFGFYFTTRSRGEGDLDSKVTATSPRHFINGRLETLEQVEARNDSREEILRSNMRGNGWARVVFTETPYRHCSHLCPGDVVLDERGRVIHTEPAK